MKNLIGKFVLFVRKVVYVTLASFDRVLQRENKVFVLAYHSIASNNFRYSVDASVVKKQILDLKKTHDFITLGELGEYIGVEKSPGLRTTPFHIKGAKREPLYVKEARRRPAVVLTFDDGYRDILLLKDFFVKHGIRPALFVLSDTKDANLEEIGTKPEFLRTREIKQLVKLGWEIGSHSETHGNLSNFKFQISNFKFPKELVNEVVDSKKKLEKELGVAIPYFSYPRGKYSDAVVEMVKKAGYKLAVTMDDGFIGKATNPLLVPRVGIDRTHTFAEFRATYSPSVVLLRKMIKKTIVNNFL